ncbi:MAG: SDR family oxidoreductase [Planctomycetaceae bacterium]|jgi:NAD(P)-dependent dehydrogenase (short-subunit alcohol dehydrogenase family)
MSQREAGSKVIVLTGVTRGLGRALCDRFQELGHTVLGCGRSADQIAALGRTFPAPHDFTPLDVTDDRAVADWAQRLLAQWGAPDLLINNAALINRNAPLWEVPADEFRAVIDVNIVGVANCLRHFVPAMVSRKSGVIVNLSSGWGRSTSAEVAPYCATKWAIEGLTQALAQELPRGMAAIPLNPGVINTEMLQSCFGQASQHYPTADEWSHQAARYLLSLGPRHNGQALSVS